MLKEEAAPPCEASGSGGLAESLPASKLLSAAPGLWEVLTEVSQGPGGHSYRYPGKYEERG